MQLFLLKQRLYWRIIVEEEYLLKKTMTTLNMVCGFAKELICIGEIGNSVYVPRALFLDNEYNDLLIRNWREIIIPKEHNYQYTSNIMNQICSNIIFFNTGSGCEKYHLLDLWTCSNIQAKAFERKAAPPLPPSSRLAVIVNGVPVGMWKVPYVRKTKC